MKLRKYLDENGISTYAFAERCGVSQSVVFRWASGETRPDWSNVPAITAASEGAVTALDFVPQDDD